jgi:glucose/arabinose dehydrogenase
MMQRRGRGLRRGLVVLAVIGVVVVGLVWFGDPLANGILRLFGISVALAPGREVAPVVLPGFAATVFARDLQAPRLMAVGPDGTVYVAEQAGRVSALPDANKDGVADTRITVAEGLDAPNSVVALTDTLLVGERGQVTEITLGPDHRASGRRALIPGLPTDGVHTTKTVLVGPEGRIYVAMGSSCNVCEEGDPARAAVSVYAPDGSGGRVFAKGLRNAVGLAVNPWTQAIWATNNGRDLLGDDVPPETVYALADGGDYGWPRCHAGTVVDPDFGGATGCQGIAAPLVTFQAHMAPLGLTFYQDGPFPAPYKNSLYVAFHGSWNRSAKVGYKVMRVPLQAGAPAGPAEEFVTGFLTGETAAGRPVGVTVAADGSLLVSDDKVGVIYRVAWAGK